MNEEHWSHVVNNSIKKLIPEKWNQEYLILDMQYPQSSELALSTKCELNPR